MHRGFFLRFALAWLAGFASAVTFVVLAARGAESDLAFVAAWAAIYAVPLGLVTVLPLARLAWRRRLPGQLVVAGGVLVGSLPGILQYLAGILGPHRPPPAGTGDPLYLAAAVIGAAVGTALYAAAVRRHWQLATGAA